MIIYFIDFNQPGTSQSEGAVAQPVETNPSSKIDSESEDESVSDIPPNTKTTEQKSKSTFKYKLSTK